MKRQRRKKVKSIFFRDPQLISKRHFCLGFLTFAAQFSESERGVYTQGFTQGFVCSIPPKNDWKKYWCPGMNW